MKINKTGVIVFLIIVFAAVLRLWGLGEYPAGLNADEAAIGYNDYSLLLTGKDEHGNAWPLHFESFGDYKPGGYFYLVLPFIKLMGLNILAVRLPSAILGIISVFGVMLLVKELIKNDSLGNRYSLASGFFLSISPWHLQFSRGGWEVNASAAFLILGLWLFLIGLKKPRYFLASIILLVFSMYTYHSMRIIVPLLGLVLLWKENKQLIKNPKWVLVSGLLGFILLLPLGISLLSSAGTSRFSGVGFLSQSGPEWRANELRSQHSGPNNLVVRLLHNKLITYSLNLIQNYTDHFQGNFLFISGDVIERSRVPDTGQMYLFDILLVPLGVYFLIKKRPENWQIIFLWLAVAPIAAALTFQTPHSLRAQNMVIPMVLLSSFGFVSCFDWVKNNKTVLVLFSFIAGILIFWSVSRYLHEYYVHYPQKYPAAWEFGFKELTEYLKPIENNYEKIYVTDKYDQPYILFLFYLKYPPTIFQKEVILTPRDKFGFSTVKDFGRYHFDAIDWNSLKEEKNILIVGTDEEIPNDAPIIKTIYFPNNKPAFEIVKL
jgi:4-amino-4-deoxy-L-arabinose transferase-like glycosyltransferase